MAGLKIEWASLGDAFELVPLLQLPFHPLAVGDGLPTVVRIGHAFSLSYQLRFLFVGPVEPSSSPTQPLAEQLVRGQSFLAFLLQLFSLLGQLSFSYTLDLCYFSSFRGVSRDIRC